MQLAMQAEQGLARSQPVSAQQQTPGAAVLADRGAARPATSAIAEAHSAGN
jgi:hypothetical protein